MRPFLTSCGWFALLISCHATASRNSVGDAALAARWLEGSFSSSAQSAGDPASFRDIRLHVRRIWPERTDGTWLYVEQSVAGHEDRPYRQRVYHVHADADEVVSDVFTLPGRALDFVGAHETPQRFLLVDSDALTPRSGCSIHLRRTSSASFAGGTHGAGCASELAGAHHATSEVALSATTLQSWDRGFDAAGKQVWGAEKGPYVFERID